MIMFSFWKKCIPIAAGAIMVLSVLAPHNARADACDGAESAATGLGAAIEEAGGPVGLTFFFDKWLKINYFVRRKQWNVFRTTFRTNKMKKRTLLLGAFAMLKRYVWNSCGNLRARFAEANAIEEYGSKSRKWPEIIIAASIISCYRGCPLHRNFHVKKNVVIFKKFTKLENHKCN